MGYKALPFHVGIQRFLPDELKQFINCGAEEWYVDHNPGRNGFRPYRVLKSKFKHFKINGDGTLTPVGFVFEDELKKEIEFAKQYTRAKYIVAEEHIFIGRRFDIDHKAKLELEILEDFGSVIIRSQVEKFGRNFIAIKKNDMILEAIEAGKRIIIHGIYPGNNSRYKVVQINVFTKCSMMEIL